MIKTVYDSPVGRLYIGTEDEYLVRLAYRDFECETGASCVADEVIRQLEEYFGGRRRIFTVETRPVGTPFQLRCWHALTTIEYGQTISYKEEAWRIGNAKAMRAVGQANHNNPIVIIIPCHRVVSANGDIGGYGGGEEIKKRLLDIESDSLKKNEKYRR